MRACRVRRVVGGSGGSSGGSSGSGESGGSGGSGGAVRCLGRWRRLEKRRLGLPRDEARHEDECRKRHAVQCARPTRSLAAVRAQGFLRCVEQGPCEHRRRGRCGLAHGQGKARPALMHASAVRAHLNALPTWHAQQRVDHRRAEAASTEHARQGAHALATGGGGCCERLHSGVNGSTRCERLHSGVTVHSVGHIGVRAGHSGVNVHRGGHIGVRAGRGGLAERGEQLRRALLLLLLLLLILCSAQVRVSARSYQARKQCRYEPSVHVGGW